MVDFSKHVVGVPEIDWGDDELYWRGEYARRPYVRGDRGFAHYEPAFRYGAASARRFPGRTWRDIESELAAEWRHVRGGGGVAWDEIKGAVRDAWNRVATRLGSS